jgi:hypothetical protein
METHEGGEGSETEGEAVVAPEVLRLKSYADEVRDLGRDESSSSGLRSILEISKLPLRRPRPDSQS